MINDICNAIWKKTPQCDFQTMLILIECIKNIGVDLLSCNTQHILQLLFC